MKIVIDIPEEKYEWIKNNNPNADINSIVGAVAIGTPLPKGHGRLIDADAIPYLRCASNVLDCPPSYDFTCQNCDFGTVQKYRIDGIPTIIEADEEAENG